MSDKLDLLTLNLWQEQGPWQRRLELIVEQTRRIGPDLICLQEVRQVPGRVQNQAQTLADALDMHWTFEVAQPWGGGDEGLAILSRWDFDRRVVRELPFDSDRSRRICLGVRVQPPGRTAVALFTTHLAYRVTDGDLRERQVAALDEFVQAERGSCLPIICGDFNAVPESDEIRFLRGLTGLGGRRTYYQDAFASCHPAARGVTWAAGNPYTEPLRWLPRDRRLDYVFVGPQRRDGVGEVWRCDVALDQPAADGIWCSDHYGVQATIVV